MSKHFTAQVLDIQLVAKQIYLMTFTAPKEALEQFRPGQFAHIAVSADTPRLLRRPISIHAIDTVLGSMSVIFAVKGEGTKHLSSMAADEYLDVIAPLGEGFPVAEGDEKIWLLGGGVGAAPLASVAASYPNREYTAFFGFASENEAFAPESIAGIGRTIITTDDGSKGRAGFVTQALAEALESEKPDVIFACGPTPMLRSLKKLLDCDGAPKAYVSLEERMGCGVGGCYTCASAVAGGMKRVCKDGPVFDIREVEL